MEQAKLTPYLCVNGAAEAIEFYKKAFGAKEIARHATPDGNKIMHASLEINGGVVMISDDFPEFSGGKGSDPKSLGGSPVTIHLNVPNVDAVWEQAVSAGATVGMPLEDQFWGDRYGQVVDPFGHKWSLSSPGRQFSEDEQKAVVEQFFGS